MPTILPVDITPLTDFLPCPTPKQWLEQAVEQLPVLLVDHAHCEKKAAATALSLIHRYPEDSHMLNKLSKLAREELLHFEKVLKLLKKRKIPFKNISAARYAACLHKEISGQQPKKLIDTLIVGAIIEARSCERFAALLPYLDAELAQFYASLLKSEARHFEDYLNLAKKYSCEQTVNQRCQYFLTIEKRLITEPDKLFRFHSGPLQS